MSSSLWKRAAPGLLFAILTIAVWSDPLFTGRSFTGRDLLPYNLPSEKVIHDAYASGSLPVWNPYVSGGRPLLANPNAGALYPVRVAIAPLPFAVAMRIYPVLHWIAGGLGILVLARSLGVSREGAWLGAITYAFSGVSVSEVFYPHIQPGFALLPWILFAVHRRSALGRFATPLAGILFGLDFLAGDVFTGGLAMGAAVLWILLEGDPSASERRHAFASLAGGVGLGLLIAAPQIVATALWIPETNRAVLGMKIGDATLFSISPLRLLELIVPYPFGSTYDLSPSRLWAHRVFNGKSIGLFATLYAGAIAPMAVWRLRASRAASVRFALWFAAAAVAVAVVPSLLPAEWGRWSSPLPLRNPEKLAVALSLGLSLLVARGCDEFASRPPARRRALGVGAVFAIAAALAALAAPRVGAWLSFRLSIYPGRAGSAAEAVPAALAEAGIFWMATILGLDGLRSARRSVAVSSLLLLAAVPVLATRRIAETWPSPAVFAPTEFALRIRAEDPHGERRVLGETLYRETIHSFGDVDITDSPRRDWFTHAQALWGLGTVFNGDFDAGDLARTESLRRVSGFAALDPASTPFFGNLGLQWGVRYSKEKPISGYQSYASRGGQDWDRIPRADPDLRLATRWRERPGALEALAILPKAGPGELVLETGRTFDGTARPGAIRVLSRTPSRFLVECRAPDSTWLFALRGFWRHRRVEVDGIESEAVPAYLAFSAVAIPAGVHRVEWRELVPGLSVSGWGPPIAFLTMLWFAGRRRRTLAAAPQPREAHP